MLPDPETTLSTRTPTSMEESTPTVVMTSQSTENITTDNYTESMENTTYSNFTTDYENTTVVNMTASTSNETFTFSTSNETFSTDLSFNVTTGTFTIKRFRQSTAHRNYFNATIFTPIFKSNYNTAWFPIWIKTKPRGNVKCLFLMNFVNTFQPKALPDPRGARVMQPLFSPFFFQNFITLFGI